MVERELAVIESSGLDGRPYQQQMLLLSKTEIEMVRKSYPGLIVRWAEKEDAKNWALSSKLFDDPRGIPTRSMMMMPQELKERFRSAKRQKRL